MRRCAAVLVAMLAGAGCGDDQDPEGAATLLERVRAEGYPRWKRAPGYETRQTAKAPHSDEVDIFVNPTVEKALATPGLTAWPEGSVIVKDGYSGGSLEIVAIMEKRADGWYYAEFKGGESKYSGRPDICTGCHESGSDYVRAFRLP